MRERVRREKDENRKKYQYNINRRLDVYRECAGDIQRKRKSKSIERESQREREPQREREREREREKEGERGRQSARKKLRESVRGERDC